MDLLTQVRCTSSLPFHGFLIKQDLRATYEKMMTPSNIQVTHPALAKKTNIVNHATTATTTATMSPTPPDYSECADY